jgi:hypothetical protein
VYCTREAEKREKRNPGQLNLTGCHSFLCLVSTISKIVMERPPQEGDDMAIARRNVALLMIGFSISVFIIAVTLNGYSEIMKVAEFAFLLNFLAIFSILLMAIGICLAILNLMRRKTHIRGIILRLGVARFVAVARNLNEAHHADTLL